MNEWQAPEGYHFEWFRCGPEWRIGGEGKRCRINQCRNSAVAALARRSSWAKAGFTWWHYCADHLYGRKIENGVIQERRLVKNEERVMA